MANKNDGCSADVADFFDFFFRENEIPYRKENIKIESVDLLEL